MIKNHHENFNELYVIITEANIRDILNRLYVRFIPN